MTIVKYAIVPVEPTDEMKIAMAATVGDNFARGYINGIYRSALAARPPLDDDIEEAVKVASGVLYFGRKFPNAASRSTTEEMLARALLSANGEDI